MKLLVEKGANVETKASDSSTAFIQACNGGYVEIVRFLLEKGANLNAVSRSKFDCEVADHPQPTDCLPNNATFCICSPSSTARLD